jgi:hypothetical protein
MNNTITYTTGIFLHEAVSVVHDIPKNDLLHREPRKDVSYTKNTTRHNRRPIKILQK